MLGIAKMRGRNGLYFAYFISFILLCSIYFVESWMLSLSAFLLSQILLAIAVGVFSNLSSVIKVKSFSRLSAIRPEDTQKARKLFGLKVFGWLGTVLSFPGGLIESNLLMFIVSAAGLVFIFGECCLQAMAGVLSVADGQIGD